MAAMPRESEVAHLLRREGPKYQYATGCISDGVIGAWMADLYGVPTPLNAANVKKNLSAIFHHNFKRDLADHACTQRPGYAIGHEPGLLLCSWPKGKKPTLPFPYSDEVWTGIEYQVASHCILHGLVDEGLTIVKATRGRYDGKVRNPFDEYECGSFYVRALASYALLGALSGFRYSAVERCLWFAPRQPARPFRCFFSTETAWGTVTLDAKRLTVNVDEGELGLSKVVIGSGKQQVTIEQRRGREGGFAPRNSAARFEGQGQVDQTKEEQVAPANSTARTCPFRRPQHAIFTAVLLNDYYASR